MTEERVTTIYTELGTLAIQIDMAPERGPAYLLETLTDCRRRQDRAVSLLVEVRRARVASKRKLRALKEESIHLADPVSQASLRRDSATEADLYDELTTLEACVNVTRSNLRMADSDIRLAERLMEQQRQLGTIKAPVPATVAIPDSLGRVGLAGQEDGGLVVASLDEDVLEPAGPAVPTVVATALAEDVRSFFSKTLTAPPESPPKVMTMDDLLTWVQRGK